MGVVNNFLTNLFGSIAGGTPLPSVPADISFVPTDSAGSTVAIKGENAVWLGLRNRQMQKYAYDYCAPLASICDKLAEYDINGQIEFLRSKGKGKEDYATNPAATRVKELFAQPNPLQSWEQFRGQQVLYKKVFGFCPVLVFLPGALHVSYASMMLNLPPWLFGFQKKRGGKLTSAKKLSDVVEYWTCTLDGELLKFPTDSVLILEDSFMQSADDEYILPQSRLVGLDMAVSNICAAMEANNVLLRKRGPLGIFSHDASAVKDSISGYLPMHEDEKAELQQELLKYGLSLQQYQYIISRTAVKWVPTSFNVTELGIDPTIITNTKTLCHRLSYPYVLLEQQDAKYANGNLAEKSVYQNNVIPNNTKDLNKYIKFFKTDEDSYKIVANFDNVPVLQEDAKTKAEAVIAQNEGLQIEWNNNLITRNQWLEARGYDKVPDGDVYKKDEDFEMEGKRLDREQLYKPKEDGNGEQNPAPQN